MENRLTNLRIKDPKAVMSASAMGDVRLRFINNALRKHGMPEYNSLEELMEDERREQSALRDFEASERHFKWLIYAVVFVLWAIGYWFTMDPIWPLTLPMSLLR